MIIGLSYKRNVDDVRESPSIEILDKLIKLGGMVSYHDPYVKKFPKMRKYDYKISSTNITPTNLSKFDIVCICTDHDSIDYDLIISNSRTVIDTRGRLRKKYSNLVKG